LFRDAKALPLEPGGAELSHLESIIYSLAGELELADMARLTAVDAYLQLLLTGALRCLAHRLSQRGTFTSCAEGRAEKLMRELLGLSEAHCHHRWRLCDYARALHLSEGYLREVCVRMTGTSPLQLIQESLIREAKRRLVDTALPIGAIAQELGFDDPAYFSRFFHVKTGLSPKQYRLSFRQKPTATLVINAL
jgi:AraC-like DNA-binding protein